LDDVPEEESWMKMQPGEWIRVTPAIRREVRRALREDSIRHVSRRMGYTVQNSRSVVRVNRIIDGSTKWIQAQHLRGLRETVSGAI
jgi:hypothetical protein